MQGQTVRTGIMELHLPAVPSAVSIARAQVAGASALGAFDGYVLALLTSELVSNAVLHAGMASTQDIVVKVAGGDSLPATSEPLATRTAAWDFGSSISLQRGGEPSVRTVTTRSGSNWIANRPSLRRPATGPRGSRRPGTVPR
jgi:hypothetical protein